MQIVIHKKKWPITNHRKSLIAHYAHIWSNFKIAIRNKNSQKNSDRLRISFSSTYMLVDYFPQSLFSLLTSIIVIRC